jgi:hypothetical protein
VTALTLAAALLLAPGASAEYDDLVARGVALGRDGRLEEAGEALDEACRLDPSRADAFVERGGLRFVERRYAAAARDLEAALDRREDPYTRDLLASALYLAGRSDEALAVWNPMGRPVVATVALTGLSHTLDHVVRREIRLAEGDLLALDRLRETRLRLGELHLFDRVSVRPVPRAEGRADLEVGLVERHGWWRGPVDLVVRTGVDALHERVQARYWNVGGHGLNVKVLYRWEENRPGLFAVADWPRPFGLDANVRVEALRGRQLYALDEELLDEYRGVDASLRRVLGSTTVVQAGVHVRDRTFSRPDPAAETGWLAALDLGLERRILEGSRQRAEASIRWTAAGSATASDVAFSKVVLTVSHRAFLTLPDGSALDRSVLATRLVLGRGSDGTPIDEMFAPGGSPDMELPLRGRYQARDGALGEAPLGRSLALLNAEWRRRVYDSSLFQVAVAMFYDGGYTSRGPQERDLNHVQHDVGMGIRLAVARGPVLRFDYGRGLSDGSDAFFVGLDQVF